jgi:hypothetical protein
MVHPVEDLLQAKAANDMTPIQALELIYKVQALMKKD